MQRISILFKYLEKEEFADFLAKAEKLLKGKKDFFNLDDKEAGLFQEVIQHYKKELEAKGEQTPQKDKPITRLLSAHLDMDDCLTHKLLEKGSRGNQLQELENKFRQLRGKVNGDNKIVCNFIINLLMLEKAQQIVNDNEELWKKIAEEAKEGRFSHIVVTCASSRQDYESDCDNFCKGGSFAPLFKLIPFAIKAKLKELGAGDVEVDSDLALLADAFGNLVPGMSAENILEELQFIPEDVELDKIPHSQCKKHVSTKIPLSFYKLHRSEERHAQPID